MPYLDLIMGYHPSEAGGIRQNTVGLPYVQPQVAPIPGFREFTYINGVTLVRKRWRSKARKGRYRSEGNQRAAGNGLLRQEVRHALSGRRGLPTDHESD